MKTFDVFEIRGDHYVVVQVDHLLTLNSVVVVPALPRDAFPALRGLTVDIDIAGEPFRVRAHMPLTIDANLIRTKEPVYRLSADEGQRIKDGVYAVIWGP